MKPLITVIVPVYNVEKYIDRCVQSIVNQTYKNLEIILVDDGSPDNCPAICDEWAKKDNRIRVIHKENGGVSAARNEGIEASKGEYIAFVDSDDYVEQSFIFDLYKPFTESDNISLSVCGLYDNEKIVSADKPYIILSKQLKMMLFNIIKYPYFEGYVWNKMYCRDIIIENNIRFESNLKMCEDTLFNFSYIGCTQQASIVPKAIYHYNYRNDSVMRLKPLEADLNMLPLIENFLLESKSEDQETIVIWAFKYWIKIIDDALINKGLNDYYNKAIGCVRKYKSVLLKSKDTTFVEKLFVVLIDKFLCLYKIYKIIKLR